MWIYLRCRISHKLARVSRTRSPFFSVVSILNLIIIFSIFIIIMSSSIYDIISSQIQTDHPELANMPSRTDFSDMVYHTGAVSLQTWLDHRRYFIGSRRANSTVNVNISDPNVYPFADKVNEADDRTGPMMQEYEQVGETGESKIEQLMSLDMADENWRAFFNTDNSFCKRNRGKMLWHEDFDDEKEPQPFSLRDYQIMFSATPDFLGVNKRRYADAESELFPETKIDKIKSHHLLDSVMEVKSSVSETKRCDARRVLLETTALDEHPMFYQLSRYKSTVPAVATVTDKASLTINFYHGGTPLLATDTAMGLYMTEPRVHNAVLEQAKTKLAACKDNPSEYNDLYTITCKTSQFYADFHLPYEHASKFVDDCVCRYRIQQGRKMLRKQQRQNDGTTSCLSSAVRSYIFNTKSTACKKMFNRLTEKTTAPITRLDKAYTDIDHHLRENVQVLLAKTLDDITVETSNLHDVRITARTDHIHQLLREMTACLRLTNDDGRPVIGYLVMPSLNANSMEIESLVAFRFDVSRSILRRFKREVMITTLFETWMHCPEIPLTPALRSVLEDSASKKKRPRSTPVYRPRKQARGVVYEDDDDDDV